MDRRDAVIKISWILKSAYLAPALLTGLASCRNEVSDSDLSVFSNEQDELVKAVADTILPRTESPSASEVKVNSYMDLLLNEVFDDPARESFMDGLDRFQKNCKSFSGSNFTDLDPSERAEYLVQLEKKTSQEERPETEAFFSRFKTLAILIYFSTEEGMKQNMAYTPVPGPYLGDVEVAPDQRIRIGNYGLLRM